MIRQLATQRTTPERFSVDIPFEEARRLLYCYYSDLVARRGRSLEFDAGTRHCIEQAARWLTDPSLPPGLMLQGLYGNGKTTLMRAIAALVDDLFHTPRHDLRVSVRIVNAKAIARLATDRNAQAEFDALVREKILAIDDLGEEPAEVMVYGMLHTPVKDLLLERYAQCRTTIVTTNLVNTPDRPELATHYGERVVDRFREMMHIVVFGNPSYRQRR